jgi:ribose/xylose/arabinose/galactoside ABC-type transport system permease subunit
MPKALSGEMLTDRSHRSTDGSITASTGESRLFVALSIVILGVILHVTYDYGSAPIGQNAVPLPSAAPPFVFEAASATAVGFAPPIYVRSIVFATIKFPPAIVIWIAVAILLIVGMRHTFYGRYLYALGGNRTSAARLSISERKYWVAAYTISGCAPP